MPLPVTPLVAQATAFATKAHEGQERDYGGGPYIQHPKRVQAMVSELPGATEEMVIAGVLHDVVEDTDVRLEEIRELFGAKVAMLVGWLTNPDKLPGENRAAYKARTFARLSLAPAEAKRIKLCDRIDNLRDTQPRSPKEQNFGALYAKESRLLLEAVFDADHGLAKILEGEIQALEVRLQTPGPAKTLLPHETPFTYEELELLKNSPFKGPDTPYPPDATL